MSFLECDTTGITGRCLSDKILGCLNDYGLDITKLRGQAYHEAGNVAGSIQETAALITKKYPLALYLHWASHSLNLAVAKSLQVTSVRNMMGVVDRVSAKFYRRVSFQYER
ncbi:52 kDa repressor of the inhibitor of the protein kinase-like [Oopsacas minuta]|uniref:52 kDa repressor of the inhibitor of the protein kinase-like n=1 Tax=Oopsacas minuta TaxID=111878 RepID=A0AAV7KGL4_9METZ|nr:52 kDa repressor of the inhibitor of the protein kinase-like [Oopsacas minuta]